MTVLEHPHDLYQELSPITLIKPDEITIPCQVCLSGCGEDEEAVVFGAAEGAG